MNPNAAVSLLRELVAIPSVNPMGRVLPPGLGPEKAIADFVASRMKKMGLDVQVEECEPGRPNAIGLLEKKGKPLLLLDSHLDTVPVDGMDKPFDPVLKNEQVFGRGSCDTKATMAMFLTALEEIFREGKELSWSVLVAGTMDEELYARGAAHLARILSGKNRLPELAVFGEPTGLHIIHAHKGIIRLVIETFGKSCHSSRPESGVNAFYPMAEILQRIQKLNLDLKKKPDPVLGPATLNPGVISGGISINTVPDRAVVEIDVRITPGQNPEMLLSWLAEAFIGIDPASYRIHPAFHHSPPMHTDKKGEGAIGLRKACHSHHPSTEFQTAPYATDAQGFAPFGVPCLVFGPGDIALAHTPGECVNVPELETGVRILKDFLTR